MIQNTQKISKLLVIILVKLSILSSLNISEKARASEKFTLAKNWQNVLSKPPKHLVNNHPNIKSTEITEKSLVNQPFLLAQNYQVGDYVEVLWEENWYLGKILEINNNQYCITYPTYDDSWDECLGNDRLRPIQNQNSSAESLRLNQYIEVLWQNEWYLAKILEIKNNQYCITYVGHDRSWNECIDRVRIRIADPRKIDAERLRLEGYRRNTNTNIEQHNSEFTQTNRDYSVNEYVEVLWQKQWHLAQILEIKNNRYCINYVGYDSSWDECVDSDRLRQVNSRKAEAERLRLEADNLVSNAHQYQKGLETAKKSLKIYQEIGDKSGLVQVLSSVGWAYYWLNDYVNAIDYYQQSFELAEEIDDDYAATARLYDISKPYLYLGIYHKSLEYQKEYLARGKEIKDTDIQARALEGIGDIYYFQKNYKKAIEYYQQSAELGRKAFYIGGLYTVFGRHDEAIDFFENIVTNTNDIYTKAASFNQLGQNYLALGNYDKAINYFQEQLTISQEIQEIHGESEAFESLGITYLAKRDLKQAEKNLRSAIIVKESIRKKLGGKDLLKVSLFETQIDTYNQLQKVLVQQNQIKDALEIAERGRARAFVELLFDRLSSHTITQANIEPPTFKEIQQIAAEQTATIVEYSIIEEQLYIWVIQPTGEIAFRQIELKSVLENKTLRDLVIDTRRALLVKPYQPQIQLKKLYKLLIEPIADILPTNAEESVIFIPQKELFLIPFVALMDEGEKYLIEKHTILTAPAIQVLELTHKQRAKNKKANPQNDLIVGLPRNNNQRDLVVGNPSMPKLHEQPLEPLVGAEIEAKQIADFLETQAIIGKQATESLVKKQMENSRVIHIATHGLLTDIRELGIPGALALTPDKNNDGFLTYYEILELNLNAELVVLSACDTGRGAITGDGVIGLSRSFLAAGAPSIIVSLWKVPDDATQLLMVDFYHQLNTTDNKAKALRQAMLTTLKKFPEVKNWAAFTLTGEAN
ncbi:MAG: CHAT domain-containing protein [Okeania sp. SIO3B5]|uniref:CHAT domain-containing protein n=1 Tax=Okeania sp. SIO3B5 TaxID=2607811 RepID=UPI0014007705|nr:CHAT domain-containing protein [Okeania sp. SIO3B5]NEO57154.1 CHAT domain-containing protein [Okeania sp. SIO3B5]